MYLRSFDIALALMVACFFTWLALRAYASGRVRLPLPQGHLTYYSRRWSPGAYHVVTAWYVAFGIAAFAMALTFAVRT